MNGSGLCIWLTGLSGAGKSTLATALAGRFEQNGRTVTLLDGDRVRTELSAGLGFSRCDRCEHARRVAYVAREVVRHGGVAIAAVITPYREARAECRRIVGEPHFIEVFVDTPLQICERRDSKGLYARARRGEITLTGITDPYEPPLHPDYVVDTETSAPEHTAAFLYSSILTGSGQVKGPLTHVL